MSLTWRNLKRKENFGASSEFLILPQTCLTIGFLESITANKLIKKTLTSAYRELVTLE
jgi:hypothetical protein